MRQKVRDKTGGKCYYCGEVLPNRWHMDHFHPLRRNEDGTVLNPENENFKNLVPACPPCNLLKNSYSIEDFRWLIQNMVVSLNRDVSIYRHAKKYGLIKETEEKVVFYFEKMEENENEQI